MTVTKRNCYLLLLGLMPDLGPPRGLICDVAQELQLITWAKNCKRTERADKSMCRSKDKKKAPSNKADSEYCTFSALHLRQLAQILDYINISSTFSTSSRLPKSHSAKPRTCLNMAMTLMPTPAALPGHIAQGWILHSETPFVISRTRIIAKNSPDTSHSRR